MFSVKHDICKQILHQQAFLLPKKFPVTIYSRGQKKKPTASEGTNMVGEVAFIKNNTSVQIH